MARVAILDDYQQRALASADWSVLPEGSQVTAFKDHLFEEDALVQRLQDFDVVIGMRERTPFRRSLLERLPNLRLLMTTGFPGQAPPRAPKTRAVGDRPCLFSTCISTRTPGGRWSNSARC